MQIQHCREREQSGLVYTINKNVVSKFSSQNLPATVTKIYAFILAAIATLSTIFSLSNAFFTLQRFTHLLPIIIIHNINMCNFSLSILGGEKMWESADRRVCENSLFKSNKKHHAVFKFFKGREESTATQHVLYFIIICVHIWHEGFAMMVLLRYKYAQNSIECDGQRYILLFVEYTHDINSQDKPFLNATQR